MVGADRHRNYVPLAYEHLVQNIVDIALEYIQRNEKYCLEKELSISHDIFERGIIEKRCQKYSFLLQYP